MTIKTKEDMYKKYIDLSSTDLKEMERIKGKLEEIGVNFYKFGLKDVINEPLIYVDPKDDFLYNTTKLDKSYKEITIEQFLKE